MSKYDQRKPEALDAMERLAVESVTSNPKFARRKRKAEVLIRALYERAEDTGLITVPGGERSLREQTGLERKTIRELLRLFIEAGEIADVTPGDPGSAQRRAHRAAGQQSEYRLRDRRPRGRKAATEQPAATVEMTHTTTVETTHGTTQATPSMGHPATVEMTPSTTNVVRLGYSLPSKGQLVSYREDHLTDGGGYGLGASATQQTNSPVAANSSAVDNSPVTANHPRRPPVGADRALVFRFNLSPMCREIYLLLTDQPVKVNHLAMAINTAWSNVNGCLLRLGAFGLAERTAEGWVRGDADPFTVHTSKAATKAAAIRNENRAHYAEQEQIRAEYTSPAEVQPVEVAMPEPSSEDDARYVWWNGLRILVEDLPPDERPLPSSNTAPVARVLEEHTEQCDNKPMNPPDGPTAFDRLVAGTRCRVCDGEMPFGEEHIGIHYACEFPDTVQLRSA